MPNPDVEFRADLDSVLREDPIARLGFDGPVRFLDNPERGQHGAWYVTEARDNPLISDVNSQLSAMNQVDAVVQGDVAYSSKYGSSKDVIAHEMRHRGLDRLYNVYDKDPQKFSEDYGLAAAEYIELTKRNAGINEWFTEVKDNPEATWIDDEGQERNMTNTFSSVEGYRADEVVQGIYSNLSRAAEDSMRKFAEGGYVDMYKQTEMAFDNGGMATDGAKVEPKSGNKVPPGSLKGEVKDNIDIKVSGGEYIVPADVLQFYGLKHFEDLRNKAKEKLAELNAGGRIGGQPVAQKEQAPVQEELPFDVNELAVEGEPGFAEGGQVFKPQFAPGRAFGGPSGGGFGGTGGLGSGVETRVYENSEGAKRYYMFINGVPTRQVEEGFYPEGEAPKTTTIEDTGIRSAGSDEDSREANESNRIDVDRETREPFDPSGMTMEDLDRYSRGRDLGGKLMRAGGALLGAPGALIGGLMNQAQAGKTRQVVAELQERIKNAANPEERSQLEQYLGRIEDDQGGMLGRMLAGDGLLGGIFKGLGGTQRDIDDAPEPTPSFQSTRGGTYGDGSDDRESVPGISVTEKQYDEWTDGGGGGGGGGGFPDRVSGEDLSFGADVGSVGGGDAVSGESLGFSEPSGGGSKSDKDYTAGKVKEFEESGYTGGGFSKGGLVRRRK